ncbi:hypothetical protein F5Y03DRAFT_385532 [Xylaria venustula]|nr:hypothetical protein F5Y03DRAFT_385532 [Xylaria venustula]
MTQPIERLMKHRTSKLPQEVPFLLKRDACSDAFGSGWSGDICSPSDTLCCLVYGSDFPRCEVHIDRGWCCVGKSSTDNCYIDQPSECDTPNSVLCTHFAEGVSEACCPPLTSCVDEYNATESLIRCQISYSSLILLDVQSARSPPTSMSTKSAMRSTSTSASLILSSSSTRGPTETMSSAGASLPAQSKPKQSLSTGGIVGSVIGTVAGIVLSGAVAYYFHRQRRIAKYGNPNVPNSTLDKAPTQPQELPQEGSNTRYELSAGD